MCQVELRAPGAWSWPGISRVWLDVSQLRGLLSLKTIQSAGSCGQRLGGAVQCDHWTRLCRSLHYIKIHIRSWWDESTVTTNHCQKTRSVRWPEGRPDRDTVKPSSWRRSTERLQLSMKQQKVHKEEKLWHEERISWSVKHRPQLINRQKPDPETRSWNQILKPDPETRSGWQQTPCVWL